MLDENGLPVKGASVTAGESNTVTDIDGNFHFTNIRLNSSTGYIKVVKQGYFLGSRTIATKPNSTHFAEIELIPKKTAGKFVAAAGGTITVPNGGSVLFETNSIINGATQIAYAGEVTVAAHFINPSAVNFSATMPGDLRGITTNNQESALQSFGMLVVELSGSGGEQLQLAAGKTATLTFPIPASLLAQASPTIPLWYFDEAKGLWAEEGSATKQGNNYIGKVSHFSFWNVDKPYPLINFEAVIMDENEQLLPQTKVEIRMQGDSASTSGSGYTDINGKVSGKIPANQKLQLNIYNKCNQIVQSLPIGPFSGNTNFETITVPSKGNTVINFSGTMKNCNDEPVTEGFVNIFINGANYRTKVTNGNYSTSVITCSNNLGQATISGFDNSTSILTDSVKVSLSGGSNHTVSLKACGATASEFIKYNLDGTNYTLVRPGDSLACYRNSNITYVESFTSGTPGWQDFYFKFNGTATTGRYYIYTSGISVEGKQYTMQDSIFVNVTEYGAKGAYVSGNFTGNLKRDSLNRLFPITCNFRIKRTN
ncbi:hypothetical protein OCK74_20610 [Chitinophagaceae bacterium LB-8]|uniref:Carboxypeptidase regulatory-like domain-containing protein n=1 Tax=Paraflavisolibacter caeni TaxID=2982496 RepID=A0A9X2XYG6_9BACT|nr:hypothetical protein [Paraflavisolibacter caeni]MCU7551535.1 hypothetical protein [Paraflavisolibacter caeni]